MVSIGSRRITVGVVLVVLIVLAGCTGTDPIGPSGNQDVYADAEADFDGENLQVDSGGVGSYYDGDGDRVVVRTAEMAVRVEEFEPAFQELRTIADDHGGYLGDRSQSSEGEWDRGTITVRVPAAEFSAARDAITDLGRVESEQVDAKDFSAEYDRRADRIERLREDEQRFEALLANASNASEATRLRSELREIRDELDRVTADQAQLERREAFSTITVTMTEPTDRKPPATYTSEWGFSDAFFAALFVGTLAIKAVIVFFGVIIPVGIAAIMLGVFGILCWRLWRVVSSGLRGLLGEGRDDSDDSRESAVADADG
ncbi:DUF4349 domain-containing protein [Halococcoides cellulosivorans]|uniref:DUF4349 domain-containing protein n=1 Tax=Halococcoides cellulosivorans TaxID=1679096 RepID=A0A2R4X452_9EURY|nr:DUF4349 domain-containing protein [Halococcoides cellulosivorans]AWB28568.1 DUF4349 domain-containing protein [Halococcoides cellulosivorans]